MVSVGRLKDMRRLTATISFLSLNTALVPPRPLYSSEQGGPQEIQCTPALEGRMIRASSGVWLRVPFVGTLMTRTLDGRIAPAINASIAIASEPCPRGRPHLLPLDGAGRFGETFDLETDSHVYCRRGKAETEDRVSPIRLRLSSPGCESLEISFSGEPGPYALELVCAAAPTVEPSNSGPVSSVGAHVALTDGLLSLNNTGSLCRLRSLFLNAFLARQRMLLVPQATSIRMTCSSGKPTACLGSPGPIPA